MVSSELVVKNCHIATMSAGSAEPYGTIRNGLLAVSGGRISWIGSETAAPEGIAADAHEVLDLGGGWLTPGLIDAHTHLIFGGNRASEFEQRLGGASYEEIARAGGGILSSVSATRGASDSELASSGARRLGWLVDSGCTSVEIKSGYGLDLESELRMLRAAKTAGADQGVSVSTTLLAAHALPPEYRDDREGYLDLICKEIIPEAARAGLADGVDAFCEGIAFNSTECARVLETGADLGMGVRLHADQLSDSGGAALAARLSARSADHLEYASDTGARSMAASGTAAVLLPGAFYYLGETQKPPISGFREHGVPMVVASDLNPGSSPLASPLLAMNMASVLFGLTPEETLIGMTRNAAPVLGYQDRGALEIGMRADLAAWSIESPVELTYWVGGNPCVGVWVAGSRVR